MKNVSSLKSNKIESPKTPGGISKSLLTPCRRLGLSRNWKKVGPSPFVSPITGGNCSSAEVKVQKRETRKRKERMAEDEIDDQNEERPQTPVENDTIVLDISESPIPFNKNKDVVDTPARVVIPRKKKSKTALSPLDNNSKDCSTDSQSKEVQKQPHHSKNKEFSEDDAEKSLHVAETVSTPVRVKSDSKIKKNMSLSRTTNKVDVKHDSATTDTEIKENVKDLANTEQESFEKTTESKPKSPIELTKECLVVIKKKIYKTDTNPKTIQIEETEKEMNIINVKNSAPSQTLFNSDTDEEPLSDFIKKNSAVKKIDPQIITIDEDDDLAGPIKVEKLENKNTSTRGLKFLTKQKAAKIEPNVKKVVPETKPSSQSSNSFDDDDEDFEFENKRTIVIRKTYDKVNKPTKAKSTGSITQRDIDDLRARIEMKKKLLLAKAMTGETEELRGLIKKWQKGCQDALMELMDLMKSKFPHKQNMDYSEMLQTLKIPVNLVGYDSENDCFNTPDDSNIILSKFNDL